MGMSPTESPWDLPADLELFLVEHAEAQIIVAAGELLERQSAADFHPKLRAIPEGPRLLREKDSIRLAAVRAYQGARNSEGRACVRLEEPFNGFTHLSACDLREYGATVFLLTTIAGMCPPMPREDERAPAAFRIVTDLQSKILEADRGFGAAVGVDPEMLASMSLLDLVRQTPGAAIKTDQFSNAAFSLEAATKVWIDGLTAGFATSRIRLGGQHGSEARWYQMTQRRVEATVDIVLVDVTADVQTATLLQHSARELQVLAETVPIGLFRSTTAGEIIFRNSKLNEVFGMDFDSGFPIHLVKTLSGDSALDVLAEMLISTSDDQSEATLDVQFQGPGAPLRYLRLRTRGYQNFHGRSEVVGSVQDVSHEYEQRFRLQKEVSTDPLSGAASRRGLEAILEQRLGQIGSSEPFAVLLCDLDGFKQVNDSLGHEAGDAVIAEVGRRLMEACRSQDSVGRLGGDEFVVVAEGISTYEDGLEFAERIMSSLRAPFAYSGAQIVLSGSIGVAISETGSTVLGLLQMADHAMYKAKRSGRNQAQPYQSPDASRTLSPLALRRDLRRAMRDDSLDHAYQPIVAIESGSVDIAEALLRWEHEEQGFVSPGVIIPVAERSGLIRRLGQWSIDRAVRDAARLNERLAASAMEVRVAINVSAIQLSQPELADQVSAAIERWDASPHTLSVELTESHLLENVASASKTLEDLSAMGLTIAVDDFGSGYSSLKYLLSLPAHVLKLDPEITAQLDTARCRSVVTGMARMTADLGMDLIIEGVEEEWQLDAAREAGVTHAQGFLLGRPMPIDDLERMILAGPQEEIRRSALRSLG